MTFRQKMGRKLTTIAALMLAGACIAGAWTVFRGLSAYRSAMKCTPPPLKCATASDRLNVLLSEIEAGEWRTTGEGDSGCDELFARLGLPAGMDGYIEFFGFTPSPFSFFDADANRRMAEIAIVRTALTPRADDGLFHVASDKSFGAIFVSGSVVSFHRVLDGTCIDGSMVKVAEVESDARPNAAEPPRDSETLPRT